LKPVDFPRLAGVNDTSAVCNELRSGGQLVELPVGPTATIRLHARVVAELGERIAAVLESMHARQPLRAAFSQTDLAARLPDVNPAVLTAAIAELQRLGRLQIHKDGVALGGKGPQLSRSQQDLYSQLVERFRAGGFNAPNLAECTSSAAKNKQAVGQLLALAVSRGQLVAIGPDYWLHADIEADARRKVAAEMARRASLTVSQIRELLSTTRKYAVPLCEYWDKIGFTARRGDQRVLKAAG
jgi:selenocysteine-specific elongation factor